MPVVKASSSSFGPKSTFSPYNMNHFSRSDKAPIVRIHTPSLDGPYAGHDYSSYDSFDDSQFSMSQWMHAGPLYPEPEAYESAHCPSGLPSLTQLPNIISYDEPLEDGLFAWPSDGQSGYDSSFSSAPDARPYYTFSPPISVVSCSPRSDHSGLSLSPQPNAQEMSNAFNFDYSGSITDFSPASVWRQSGPPINHSPRPSMSHSPSPSCSSLDAGEMKMSHSRETSPSRLAVDPQQQRRRFPCLIIGCERRFTSQYTLKVHMEAHKPKPRVSFPCTLGCSERFSRQHDRLRHEVAKHGKVCEFSCDDCGRFFSTKKTLGNHKCPVAQGGTRWVTN